LPPSSAANTLYFVRRHQPDRARRIDRHGHRVSRVSDGDAACEAAPAPADGPACGVDDGEGDYLNCPLSEVEYNAFYDAVVSAESATVHDFDKEKFFEGCLPIEVMAHRGRDTLRFGPMKPVGAR
jgi:methylenetetrahydrofolate--tRNA-(uracil-5-)-methyltransferase